MAIEIKDVAVALGKRVALPQFPDLRSLAALEGQRWSIADGFDAAKNELGFDHIETRSWHGWLV